MDWGRIKTIFIIAFLLLNTYLLIQFSILNQSSSLTDTSINSIKDVFTLEDINYSILSDETISEQSISVTYHSFNYSDFTNQTNQIVRIDQGKAVYASFITPVQINVDNLLQSLQTALNDEILFLNDYQLGVVTNDKIILSQRMNDYPLFKNDEAQIILNISSDNKIISYKQTYLDLKSTIGAKTTIITSIQAAELLYNRNLLKSGNTIDGVELGYYPTIKLANTQIVTPTWKIIISNTAYYINAVDGQYLTSENTNN